MPLVSRITDEQFTHAWSEGSGSAAAVARILGCSRALVDSRAKKMKLKKLSGGQIEETPVFKKPLPQKGGVKRYIITSAQNNTPIHEKFWYAIQQLADHYDAEILIGTFTYNQNRFGKMAVKRGTVKEHQSELWYAPELEGYLPEKEQKVQLAPGLVWCGNMNILPTNVDPLSGLETYTHRESSIFPHAKVAMRSVATMQGEGAKLMYTTGAVTLRNYIQKKEGQKAEHHHRYAALVVEVNDKGNWWVRQIGISNKGGVVQDLDVVVNEAGVVTEGNKIEAVTWGDLHATWVDPVVVEASHRMLDELRPSYQFLHDVLEGVSINRHVIAKGPDPHYAFNRWLRGLHRVDEEFKQTASVIASYLRPWCKTVIPDSNHDGWWIKSWLAKYDYRYDPANAELFLALQLFTYKEIRRLTDAGLNHKQVNLLEHVLKLNGLDPNQVKCLLPDESFKTCKDKIENGMHGHLGPNGSRGTHNSLSTIGRRANTAHEHYCGIYNGLYVAGHSTKDNWSYQYGPSAGSHSHIVTYPNGMRAIITMWKGQYRAASE